MGIHGKSMTKKKPHKMIIGLAVSSIQRIMQKNKIEFEEAFNYFIKNSKSSLEWDYDIVKSQIKERILEQKIKEDLYCPDCGFHFEEQIIKNFISGKSIICENCGYELSGE